MSRFWLRLLAAPLSTAPAADGAADAIVVLGCPTHGGALTRSGEQRVQAGLELYRRGGAPLLCFTGGTGEADAMAARALELGAPAAAVRVEPAARTTEENARLCAQLLRAEGCSAVWVVTHAFHMRRALFWFARAGMEARGWQPEEPMEIEGNKLAARMIAREYLAWGAIALRRGRG